MYTPLRLPERKTTLSHVGKEDYVTSHEVRGERAPGGNICSDCLVDVRGNIPHNIWGIPGCDVSLVERLTNANKPFVQKPFAVTDWDTLNSSLRQMFAAQSPICYC